MIETTYTDDRIAVIGMAGRFPGAQSTEDLWEMLCTGREAIRRMRDEELEDSADPLTRASAQYVPARGLLDDVDQFDAELFNYLPRDAELTDPQQRIMLETAWAAMEDAGYAPKQSSTRVGVFVGSSINTYLLTCLANNPQFTQEFTEAYQVGAFSALIGNGQDFLATRISYKLDLRGPAMTVQSACSTSLLAVAQACGAIRAGQADMAIAGGVSISFPQKRGYLYQPGGMVSQDGHCRPFDADASGTVFGAGAGAVILKRAADAVADGDYIYAMICGVGVSNDGSEKVGYAAPSVRGQRAAIEMAHEDAGFGANSISFVECHGTGTPLGDPIEVEALSQVFRTSTDREGLCTLGSIKGNIGHLDVAAGVTGFIKTALALDREMLPGTKHFRSPNPRLKLNAGPFRVTADAKPWLRSNEPRRAGVSAFGVGGTNVHLLLEEAPVRETGGSPRLSQLLVVSALTEKGVAESVASLRAAFQQQPDLSLADAAYTLATGRETFPFRATIVSKSVQDFATGEFPVLIQNIGSGRDAGGVVFMFPGQGSQYAGMSAGLYASEPVYRKAIDHCDDLLFPALQLHIRDLLLSKQEDEATEARLRSTALAQPVLFATSYASALLWMSWGIKPTALLGHSLGEFVAACLAGTILLEDALTAVAARGAMMDALPRGGMLAVNASLTEIEPFLTGQAIDIAAENGARSVVLSGPTEPLTIVRNHLQSAKFAVQELKTSHAFHSSMVASVVPKLELLFAGFKLCSPQIPIVSTVTGKWLTSAEATSAGYWASHCRERVQFSKALTSLLETKPAAWLECGPGNTLTNLVKRQSPKGTRAYSTLPVALKAETDSEHIQTTLGSLWKAGMPVDWQAFYAKEERGRVPLPSYCFQRKRFWPPPFTTALPQLPDSQSKSPNILIENTMPTVSVEAPTLSALSRQPLLLQEVTGILESLSGLQLTVSDGESSFLELGLDSLFLTQLASELQKKYKVPLSFRQLLNELSSADKVAAYLNSTLPAPAPASVAVVPTAPSPASLEPSPEREATPEGLRSQNTSATQLMQQQITAMSELFRQQIQTMNTVGTRDVVGSPSLPEVLREAAHTPVLVKADVVVEMKTSPRVKQSRNASSGTPLTEEQKVFIQKLISRYEKRTQRSKSYTQQYRGVFADPRAVNGFRKEWKEMTYGLVVERSKGSKLWDIDGNKYIDLVNGFGPTMFGHGPDFVIEAVKQQLDTCFAVGPQSPLAGDTAQLIAEMTKMERVTFCNTGSEAVMAAMRLARTVTGRDKVVFFAGDYHGQFDEVLVRGVRRNGLPFSLPGAPGIPAQSVGNIVVLEYGESIALEYLREHAEEIAAVIVEPVQSRHPNLQPREFLLEARRITELNGIALIFDEVVTGFRIRPGGAQEYFGIQADMATYGKVAGGGLPIGILAGKATFMDALDGGSWQFGDDSLPEVGMTFFAGTFVRHPLVLAATYATLMHIRSQGETLYQSLNGAAEKFANEANSLFAELGVSFVLEQCGSIMYLAAAPEIKNSGLLFAMLRERGIYAMEHFPLYLTTTHTPQDLEQVLEALRTSIVELQAAGLLPKDVVAPVLDHDSAPLTEPQMEILLAAQMGDAENCAFNESCTLRLEGPLDEAAFEASWNEIVCRHDALRLRLTAVAGIQKLSQASNIGLTHLDLSRHDKERADSEMHLCLQHAATTPFNLLEGPLVRARLVRLPDSHYSFVFTAHHMVCDGWSINIIMDELAALYSAGVKNTALQLPRASSFLQYARDLKELTRSGSSRSEAYWSEVFQELPASLDLPTTQPRGLERSFTGDTLILEWPADLKSRLRTGGAKHGCTLFVTLLGVWQMLLQRLAGESEAVVVIPSAAQSLMEESVLVGHCVHLLPIRGKAEIAQTAVEYLGRLKQRVLDAYEHQDLTFGSLLQLVKVPREAGRLPLSEFQFNLEKLGSGVEFSGLHNSWGANPKAFVNFDLFLNVVDTAAGLRLECDFNSDLYSKRTIERWIGCYREMLEGFLRNPLTRIDELPLVSTTQQLELLSFGKGPQPRSFPAFTFMDQFSKHVAATPNAIAIEFYGRKATYADLNERSSKLAQRLVVSEIVKGDLVGIYLERSIDMVVAMIGILRAGAAYVPLDPLYPRDRIGSICGLTSMQLLVTSEEHVPVVQGLSAQLLVVDREYDAMSVDLPTISPLDNAYVIFTSGSTGTPKGVQIAHSNLINALEGVAKVIGLEATARLLAVTTLSFDIAALELLMPLVCGATVVIAQRDDVTDGIRLGKLLRASRATIMQATPITWRMLVASGMPMLPHLTMLCGGEGWDRGLADSLLRTGGALWNMYGPTETTIWSAYQRVMDDGRPVGIENSLPNQRLYILDSHQQLLPIGVSGELYIAGEGVGSGYYHLPELSSSHFMDDQFSARPGSRMYRTGDRVCRQEDGTIEISGRFDDQIKLRGFRIEPGEIEAALRGLDGVDQAFVALRNDRSGTPRLVAYTTYRPGTTIDPSAMQEALHSVLPEYMVPAMIIALKSLPLTGNNKVDRKRLPDPDFVTLGEGVVFVAPQTPQQKQLAAIWCDVLSLDQVSIIQPLFALGADSLHIFQIAARAQQVGLPVTARQLMKLKTIEAICQEIVVSTDAVSTDSSLNTNANGIRRASRAEYQLTLAR